MDEIVTRILCLPTSINGYTIRDRNGDYNVYINSRLSFERQLMTYQHELKHVLNGDFNKSGSADLIEIHAHMNPN